MELLNLLTSKKSLMKINLRDFDCDKENRFPKCSVCDLYHFEDYMVKNDVWVEAGLKLKGDFACLLCLEKKLNRKLVIEDFAEVVSNIPIFFGYQMAKNLYCK